MAKIALKYNCHEASLDKLQVDFHGAFVDLDCYKFAVNEHIKGKYGNILEIPVYINSNYCLITADILEEMFVKLMEDRIADSIVPVSRIDPHLYMDNAKTGSFFPFWEHSSLDRQDYPDLYQSGGIRIIHPGRSVSAYAQRVIPHLVDQEYLLHVDSLEKAQLAEHYLSLRMGGSIVFPEQQDNS